MYSNLYGRVLTIKFTAHRMLQVTIDTLTLVI